ncbi:zinc finger, CCHC-type containing protein [Tanacetum coccineum]
MVEKTMREFGLMKWLDQGKLGHLKEDCKGGKVSNKANGSVNDSSNLLKGQNMFNKSLQVYYVTYVSEAYCVHDDDVACDLCDLHAIPSLGNKKYDGTFIDDASRFCYVYLLHTKDEALDKFKEFKTKVESQQGSLIKRFRTDRGVVRLPDPKLKTLGKRGIECIFFGYAEHSKAFSTIRLLIALALIYNMIIYQMDVKTTFLNGELDEEVDLTNEFLSSKFSMKDMGEADIILDIRIKYESNGMAISQSHYIEKVLKKFNYFYCTPMSTLMDTSEKPMPNNVDKLSSLIYIGYPLVLEGYTLANWISNTKDNSSTIGWVFLLSGGAISWASKKQTCITSSTMEFEFVALATAGKEAEWLRNMILDIPFGKREFKSLMKFSEFALKIPSGSNPSGDAAKLEKLKDAKLAWLLDKYYYRSQESVGCSSSHANLYLTEKELYQLHLDEEALRETLEEQAMDAKAREEKIRQKQADDDEFFLTFGRVRIDSDYESSD